MSNRMRQTLLTELVFERRGEKGRRNERGKRKELMSKATHCRQRPREHRVTVPSFSSPNVDSPVIQSFLMPCVTVDGL